MQVTIAGQAQSSCGCGQSPSELPRPFTKTERSVQFMDPTGAVIQAKQGKFSQVYQDRAL